MRILFISYEWPPIGGGGGRAAERIAVHLAGRGHEVAALTSLYGDLAPEEEWQGVQLHRLRVRRSSPDACTPAELFSFMWRGIPATRRLIRRSRPDAVCAFFGIPGGPAAWWARRREGVPYLLSLRGSDVPRPELRGQQRLHRFTGPLLRRLYRGASAITAVSQTLRDAALRVAPGVAIEVVQNGVDTDWFRPRRTDGPGAQQVRLLYVGRLRDFKRVQDVIEALPRIHAETGKPVRLVVAGSGPYQEALERQAQGVQAADPQVEVRFAGWLEKEALRDAYDEADAVVLPSLIEGHPNVLLEAMAMGRPFVATDVPGTREAFEDGKEGFLVPPCWPEEIACAVVRLVSDAEGWRTFSRNARARAESMSWERVAERYQVLLERIVKGATPCAT